MDSSDRPDLPPVPDTDSPAPPGTDAPRDNTSPDVPLGAGFDLADPNSPLAPLYLRLSHLTALFLIVLFVFYARLMPIDGAVWSSLALGRWAAENDRIPTHEPLCPFSDPDAPLPASGWLARACLYRGSQLGANRAGGNAVSQLAGGVEALRVVHLLLVVGFGALAITAYARRTGSLPLGCLGLLTLVVVAPLLIGSLRPGLFGIVCFLGLLALLSRDDLPWRDVILVPPLLLLWANLDSSFVVGLILLALLLVGQLVESPRQPRTLRLLVALAGSLLLAGLLTPDGPALLPRLWTWASRPTLANLTLWQPLDFSTWRAVHVVFLATLAALTLAAAFSGRAYSPVEMAVLLGFAVLALWKQATAAYWFLVVPWLLLPQLAALGRRFSWQGTPGTPCLRKTFVGVILALAILLLVLPVGWIREKRPRPLEQSIAPDVPWPVAVRLLVEGDSSLSAVPLPELTAQLEKSYPDGKFSGVIFADETASDFLLFALPRPAVFASSEVAQFSLPHWEEYDGIRSARPDWWELLDRRGVNLIVFNPEQNPLARALKEDDAWLILPAKGQDGRSLPWSVALRKKPVEGKPNRAGN